MLASFPNAGVRLLARSLFGNAVYREVCAESAKPNPDLEHEAQQQQSREQQVKHAEKAQELRIPTTLS